jgi:hypothetical protein
LVICRIAARTWQKLFTSPSSHYDRDVNAEQSKPMKRVYVPIEDAKLDRLLEASEATGLTVEQLIQRAVAEFLEKRRPDVSD